MIFYFFQKAIFLSSFLSKKITKKNPNFYPEMSTFIFFNNKPGPPPKRGRFLNNPSSRQTTSSDYDDVPDLAPIYPNNLRQGLSLLEISKRGVVGSPSFKYSYLDDQFSTPANGDLNIASSTEQQFLSFDAITSFASTIPSLGILWYPIQPRMPTIPSLHQTSIAAPIGQAPFKLKKYPGEIFTTVEIPYHPPPVLIDKIVWQCHFCAHWGTTTQLSHNLWSKPVGISGNKIQKLTDKTNYFIVLETPEGSTACLEGDMYITLITGNPQKMDRHFSNEEWAQKTRAFKTFNCLPSASCTQDHVTRVVNDDFFDIRLLKRFTQPRIVDKPVISSAFPKTAFKAFASPVKMELSMRYHETIPITIIVQIGDQYWTCKDHTIKQTQKR